MRPAITPTCLACAERWRGDAGAVEGVAQPTARGEAARMSVEARLLPIEEAPFPRGIGLLRDPLERLHSPRRSPVCSGLVVGWRDADVAANCVPTESHTVGMARATPMGCLRTDSISILRRQRSVGLLFGGSTRMAMRPRSGCAAHCHRASMLSERDERVQRRWKDQ